MWIKEKGKRDKVGICPLCGAPNLNWNPKKQQGRCNTCQQGFNRKSLLAAGFEDLEDEDVIPLPEFEPKPLPPLVSWVDHPMGIGALEDRGWIDKHDLLCPSQLPWGSTCYYAHTEQRLYFALENPNYKPDRLMASRSIWQSRHGWMFTGPKDGHYYGKTLFNRFSYFPGIGPPDWLVLMEGINDVLGPRLWDHNTIAIMGTTVQDSLVGFLHGCGYRRLVLWMDEDENGAGQAATKELTKQLKGMFRMGSIIHGHPKNIPHAEAVKLICNAVPR